MIGPDIPFLKTRARIMPAANPPALATGTLSDSQSLDYMFSFAFQYAAQQRVDLTTAVSAADIDAGLGNYTFSSWLASYGNHNSNGVGNPEQPFVYVQFFSNPTGRAGACGFDQHPRDLRPVHQHTMRCTYADGTTSISVGPFR